MATKTISIMGDVYKLLVLNKLKGESFSDVIRRVLVKKNESILDLAGSMKSISNSDANKMKRNILTLREKSTKELYK